MPVCRCRRKTSLIKTVLQDMKNEMLQTRIWLQYVSTLLLWQFNDRYLTERIQYDRRV